MRYHYDSKGSNKKNPTNKQNPKPIKNTTTKLKRKHLVSDNNILR